MLHHISLGVSDLDHAAAFYDAALAALGYARVWSDATAIGYGNPGGGDKLAIKLRAEGAVVPAPGLRPHYGPDYFAAFVVDPDGYRIEAVINTTLA